MKIVCPFLRARGCPVAVLALTALALAACASGAPRIDPASPSGQLTQQGIQILARGDSAPAADYFRRAIDANPDNLEALTKLAAIEDSFGDIKAAQAHWQRARDLEPGQAAWHRAYAKNALLTGAYGDALAAYARVVELEPRDAKAMAGQGIAKARSGDCAGALDALKKAYDLDKDDRAIVNNLAFGHLLCGAPQDAALLLEPLAKGRDVPRQIRYNLALAYGLTGREDEAARLIAKDMTPAAWREQLAFYKTERLKMDPSATPLSVKTDGRMARAPGDEGGVVGGTVADLGTYATMELALARVHAVHAKLDAKKWTPLARVRMDDPNGPPRFQVVIPQGSQSHADLRRLCADLASTGTTCTVGVAR